MNVIGVPGIVQGSHNYRKIPKGSLEDYLTIGGFILTILIICALVVKVILHERNKKKDNRR